MIIKDLSLFKYQTAQRLEEISTLKDLETLKAEILGKSGPVALLMKELGTLEAEARKEKGTFYHQLRLELSQAFESKAKSLKQQALDQKLREERLDMTLSAESKEAGSIHPLSQAMFEAVTILQEMGFTVTEGPDIEDDYHNFTALNMPADHPARQEQDTFYLPSSPQGETLVLRTQTSPVQIRALQQKSPPLRIISPGRVYRSDYDQTHTPTFHQIEGLYIDKAINMGHLKACLVEFCRRFFDIPDLPVRFRPGYFPFTEPSAEIDIGCSRKNGRMVLGGDTEWLEILGSGMIHPHVLSNMGLTEGEWQGFAFGMGIERLAMLKYGIFDLRGFYEGDKRWLHHYGFSPFKALGQGVVR